MKTITKVKQLQKEKNIYNAITLIRLVINTNLENPKSFTLVSNCGEGCWHIKRSVKTLFPNGLPENVFNPSLAMLPINYTQSDYDKFIQEVNKI